MTAVLFYWGPKLYLMPAPAGLPVACLADRKIDERQVPAALADDAYSSSSVVQPLLVAP
ncbi:hypothetical protein [Streptomyces sp. Ac-502]|uniref:hypothetical protein n=1 Tax=Streptomyces sp. Ac-502 TaxID=3342801 RepID=UPI003862D019